MRKFFAFVLAMTMALTASAVRVHTLGDSLSEEQPAEREQKGWPQYLAAFLDNIDVVNPAKSGTSTKSFYRGYWTAAKANVQAGDYVIIQFSHNDENNGGVDADDYNLYLAQQGLATSTDLRGTNPQTTYKEYLRLYVDEIRALGANPIISSAVCRLWFKNDKVTRAGQHDLGDKFNKLVNNEGTWVYTENQSVPESDNTYDYTLIAQQIATEKGVPFINVTEATRVLFETYGEAQTKALIGVSTDGTHTNARGANMIAREVAKLLRDNVTFFADKVNIPTDATVNPTSFELGELYTGIAKVNQTLLTGFGLTPTAGSATITAGDNLEVSLDGTAYSKSVNVAYTAGTLFQQIYIRANYSEAGTEISNNVTIAVGGNTITIPVTASPISLAGGSDVTATWALTSNLTATATGMTAADMTLSGMEVASYAKLTNESVNMLCRIQNTGICGIRESDQECRGAWEAKIDVTEDRYIDFAVTAPSTMDIKVSGIHFVIAGTSTGSLRCRARLGNGSTFGQAIYDNVTGLTSNVETTVDLTPVYTIKAGETMHLRLWPWSNADLTLKYFAIRDVRIDGKAFETGADPEPEPESTWRDIKADFSASDVLGLGARHDGTPYSPVYFTVNADGSLAVAEQADAIGSATGFYNGAPHGCVANFDVKLPQGKYKFSFGKCNYSAEDRISVKKGNATITFKNENDEDVTVLNGKGTCWDNNTNKNSVVSGWLEVAEEATYTFVNSYYTPYFAVEKLAEEEEETPASEEVTALWNSSLVIVKTSKDTTLVAETGLELTVKNNNGSESDYANSAANDFLHWSNTSNSSMRYAKFTAPSAGHIVVKYMSNNGSANDRVVAVAKSVITGSDVAALNANENVYVAGYTEGYTEKTIEADVEAGDVYIYNANSGCRVNSIAFTYTRAIVPPVDPEVTGGEGTLSFVTFDASSAPTFKSEDEKITVVWSRGGGNISPASTDRGIRMLENYNFTITTPAQTKITKVEINWNNNGNLLKVDGVSTGNFLDASIKNAADEEVSTLTISSKVSTTTWDAPAGVEENVLKFIQTGKGDIYVASLRVVYEAISGSDPEPESTWRDIKADFSTSDVLGLGARHDGTPYSPVYFTVNADGSLAVAEQADAIGSATGFYNGAPHGCVANFTVTMPVGNYKFSFGKCDYSAENRISVKKGNATITFKNENDEDVTVLDGKGTCWTSTNNSVVSGWLEVTEEAEYTFVNSFYTPYFAVEKLGDAPAPEPEYPLTATWDFNKDTDQDYFTNPFHFEGSSNPTGTVHSDVEGIVMTVFVNPGKFNTDGRTELAQFNAQTRLHIPVGSTNDVVKVTLNGGTQATVGGELITSAAEFTHRVYRAEAEAGYVEIVSLGGYLRKVQVILQGDNARDDRNATVTYYDVDGTTILGTQVLQAGQTIDTYAYNANIPAGYTNNGWVDVVANSVATSKVVAADMALYPYVTKVENDQYIIPAGNGRQLYNTLKNAAENSTFYLANGTYDLGNACRTELKNDFVLLGESRSGVKVVNHPTAPGIQATSTFRITGNNVYIQHMTLRCDVSYSTSTTHGVGVALEVNGDKSICYDVDLQCNQDTYYSNGAATQRGYMKDCRIEGTVDYICGTGNIWFENTLLYNNQRYDGNSHSFNNSADVIVAPSTDEATVYGYVFNNCSIDGHNSQANNYNLARGWQNSPAATWLNTTCIITPSTRGYTTMSAGLVVRFHELNTHDNAGNPITGHNLDDCNYAANSDAIYLGSVGNYTYANVVKGSDNWDPENIIAQHNPYHVTSTPDGYATFYAEYAVALPEDVVAYTGTIKAEALMLQAIDGDVVPAGTPVILKKEGVTGSENWGLRVSAASGAFAGENALQGTAEAMSAPANCYVLGYDGAAYFGTYAEGNTIKANRAYLTIETHAAPLRIYFNPQLATSVDANTAKANAIKIICNGQILVIRDGRSYSILGNLIK